MRIKRAIEIRENIQREQRKMSTHFFSIVSKTVMKSASSKESQDNIEDKFSAV